MESETTRHFQSWLFSRRRVRENERRSAVVARAAAGPTRTRARAVGSRHEAVSGMAAVALSRVGIRRVEPPSCRGIAPGTGDVPRARGVRARGGAPRGVREEGDVLDVREGSSEDSASLPETLTDSVARARRVHRCPPAPDASWIRVVVDSVLLDDAPFEPPRDAASARASENFRAAGGEPAETVRVLTAVLRTVTDGRDRLLPLVASASLEPAERAHAFEPPGIGATRRATTHGVAADADRRRANDERREPSVPDAHRRPFRFDAPPRAPRPISRDVARPFGDDERTASSRALLASRPWPPAPAHPRRDPLGMCFEYLNNCMRPEKKEERKETTRFSSAVSDASAFTAYGGDRSGAGMHQDVDFDFGVFESRYASRGRDDSTLGPASRALETARRRLETRAAEDGFACDDFDDLDDELGGDSADADERLSPGLPPGLDIVEPRDVDDMLDALEDRVESAYLVMDFSGADRSTDRFEQKSDRRVSASARLAATLYATPRDEASVECDAPQSEDVSETANHRSEDASRESCLSPRASETRPREVRFQTAAWLGPSEKKAVGPDGDVRATSVYESRIVNLESFLALCAASSRMLPMFVSRDVADTAGLAPDAWRPSFRSVRRMGDSPEKRSRRGGGGDGRTSRDTRFEPDPEDENAIGAMFESFLRGVAASVADADASRGPEMPRLQSLIEKNARGVPFGGSDFAPRGPDPSAGSRLDLGEALLGGPVVFFRAAARAWADWYRRARQSRAGAEGRAGLAGGKEGFASRGDGGASPFSSGKKKAGPPRRSDNALRRLTGKRGGLATNALIRSQGDVGHVTALDRRSLDCVVAQRMSVAAATARRRYLSRARQSPAPKHVAAATLMLDSDEAFSFRDADPDAKTLVRRWAQRVARAASDADAYAEHVRALDETVAARAAEIDDCARSAEDPRRASSTRASPGRAVAALERAVSEERWADATLWRDALHRVNGRCADHEAVFGLRPEPGENGYH